MRQYSEAEIAQLLTVTGGDIEDQAAALAVVTSAIKESRRLGRIALGQPKSSWSKNPNMLRNSGGSEWRSSGRPGL